MLKSSRKKLIAIGCSYTQDAYEFPVWPTHLAEKLDMKCVNLGKRGAGNKYILSKIMDTFLTEKNIGIVVVMWSQFQRLDFEYSSSQIGDSAAVRWIHLNLDLYQTKIDWDYKLKYLRELYNPHSAAQDALRTFILAEKLLNNIPHLYIQGPTAISSYNTTTLKTIDCSEGTPDFGRPEIENAFNIVNDSKRVAGKSFLNSPYFDYVEENLSDKFIGWPIFSEMGGYNVDKILDITDPERKHLRISDKDSHPNGEGHKIIAQEIYDAYTKIYL